MEISGQSRELSWFLFVVCTGNEKEEQDQEELQRLNTKRTNNANKTWKKMSTVSYEDSHGGKKGKNWPFSKLGKDDVNAEENITFV